MTYGCDPLIPRSILSGAGSYRAACITLSYPLENVRQMLPYELEPGPQPLTAPGTHPLMVLCGQHSDVRVRGLPSFGLGYMECVIALPYVQWRSDRRAYRGPYAYLYRMYLNQLVPVLMGLPYAFPKQLVQIQGLPDYRVRTQQGDATLIRADIHPHGQSQRPARFPHFQDVASMFEQPFISNIGFGYVCSSMRFDLAQATMRAADATLVIERPLGLGIIPGTSTLPGIDTSALGAFYIEAPWQITPPLRPDSIRCAP